jgi:hypothetical protein
LLVVVFVVVGGGRGGSLGKSVLVQEKIAIVLLKYRSSNSLNRCSIVISGQYTNESLQKIIQRLFVQ